MAGIHALIGIGEGLITVGALAFIYAARPDLHQKGRDGDGTGKMGLGCRTDASPWFLVIASPLASSHPDGLEWVAEQKGFLDAAQGSVYDLIPDYVLPGVTNESLATILAGIFGVILVFGVPLAVAYSRRKRQESR